MGKSLFLSVVLVVGGCSGKATEDWMPATGAGQLARQAPADTKAEKPTVVAGTQAAVQDRKIIYDAQITLVVESFSKLQSELPELVKQHNGYVSNVTVDRMQGQRLSGRWTVRVPVDRYDAFLLAVSRLGVPEKFNQTAKDVTEEYVDLEARIANKKQLEQRILKLLEQRSGALKDVIDVEQELARVRGEVEQMEGRLNYLKNLTALTTVTIDASERKDYVPPRAPTFGARVAQAWDSSVTFLRQFGEGLIIVAVFFAPWLIVLILLAVPAAILLRIAVRRRSA
jgi:hypothetical protein